MTEKPKKSATGGKLASADTSDSEKRLRARSDSDRRVRQAERHSRTLRVLELIQGKARWGAKEVARELECSERTVYRDLQVLGMAGVPWYFDEAGKCYRVRDHFRFPVVALSNDELIGQAVATAIASSDGFNAGGGAKPTTRKLLASSSTEAAKLLQDASRLIQVLGLKLADHSQHQEMIGTAQRALLSGKQLEGRYRSPYQPKPVKLTLHPYRLCFIKQAWYLIARPNDAPQVRSYRLARFTMMRMLEADAEVPTDFDLNAFFGNAWGVYRGDQAYEVEILFTPEAASLVLETKWHHTQKAKPQKDGGVILSFRVDGLNEIVHWVLGWSGRAKVIRPVELRDMVVEHLQRALRLNNQA